MRARPMVSIPGGEPLLHPQIKEIVEGLVARRKYIYPLHQRPAAEGKARAVTPSKYLTFSVHMDGQKDTTTSRVPGGQHMILRCGDPPGGAARLPRHHQHDLFDGGRSRLACGPFRRDDGPGRRGMMLSPGYSYDKAPDQQHFRGTPARRASSSAPS